MDHCWGRACCTVFRVTSDQDLLNTSSPVSAEVAFEHAGIIFHSDLGVANIVSVFKKRRKKPRGGEN